MRTIFRFAAGGLAGSALALTGAQGTLAHGTGDPAPTLLGAVTSWSLDPLPWVGTLLAAATYLIAVRKVNRLSPRVPVPHWRTAAWLSGLAFILIALVSAVDVYAEDLLSVHMVQHLLLSMVAPPLLALGAPITLLLRVATPGVRNRWILPFLRSRVVRVIAHPLVAWLLFTFVMWGSHLSPLFDAALEDPLVHDVEHALYLGTALLFWWPVVGRDPSPWRLPYPARIFYLFLQMPLNSFLGVAILFSDRALYPHYLTTGRTWPPTPLEDQQLAGAIMWGVGDAGFVVAILLVIAAWMRHDEAVTRRREALEDARVAAVQAAAQVEGIGASR